MFCACPCTLVFCAAPASTRACPMSDRGWLFVVSVLELNLDDHVRRVDSGGCARATGSQQPAGRTTARQLGRAHHGRGLPRGRGILGKWRGSGRTNTVVITTPSAVAQNGNRRTTPSSSSEKSGMRSAVQLQSSSRGVESSKHQLLWMGGEGGEGGREEWYKHRKIWKGDKKTRHMHQERGGGAAAVEWLIFGMP